MLAHSLRELNPTEDDNKSESFGEPSSDESDFDFEDESSNQSYVKSQTSQSISEKSNTFDNKIVEQECDLKVDEPIACTTITPSPSKEDTQLETYDNYLGDVNGTSFIHANSFSIFSLNDLLFCVYSRCKSTDTAETSKRR